MVGSDAWGRVAGRKIVWLGIICCLVLLAAGRVQAQQDSRPELLVYCGITMVRPMTEIARVIEQRETVRVTISQGGSEDLYQSLRKSQVGDLYLPGEPDYRARHLAEGLLGEFKVVGYNQAALMVRKGDPHQIKADVRELLRKDLAVVIGSPESGSIGQETKRILDLVGLYTQVQDVAAFLAPDSRTLNAALRKGEADLILNWRATGFFPDNIEVIDVLDLDPALAKPQPLLLNLLTFSTQPDLARRFMHYAASAEGQAIFRKHGFLDNSHSPAND